MKNEKQCTSSSIPIALLERMAEMLKLLAHPHRLKILEVLQSVRRAPVHSIMEVLDLPQSATSQHLNQMRRAGILASEREGREVWYRIADPRCINVLQCICHEAERDDEAE